MTHTQIDMGGSITAGHGFERVERFAQRGLKVFSFIGDSTFFHSGITGLINAVYNGAKTSIFILDNSTTGMTGHQDNPVTGVTLMKDVTTAVDIKTLVLGCGVKPENVRTVDPYDLKATAAVVKEAYEPRTCLWSSCASPAPCSRALSPTARASTAASTPTSAAAARCASTRPPARPDGG
mgnify:CR=1 FL=1